MQHAGAEQRAAYATNDGGPVLTPWSSAWLWPNRASAALGVDWTSEDNVLIWRMPCMP